MKNILLKIICVLQSLSYSFIKFLSNFTAKLQPKIKSLTNEEISNLKLSLEKDLSKDLVMHQIKIDDYNDVSKLKLELQKEFNSESKYSDLMHQINIVEKKALNKERELLKSRLMDLYSTISAKSKDVFDKEKQELYELHNLHVDEISKAAKIVKMSIVNNLNEELDKVESSIDDIDCETCVRSTTSEPVVTKGSF